MSDQTVTDFSGKVYAIVKSPRMSFGYEAVEFTIEDGIVVAEKVLTRAPDLPSIANARAQYGMYEARDQDYEPLDRKKK